jgi:NADH pyrophosphatase NudC (nudix superfamily)
MRGDNMTEMELIQQLVNNGVAIQITFDIGKKPTVHSISGMGLKRVEAETLLEALQETNKMIEQFIIDEEFKYCQDCGKELDKENNQYHLRYNTCDATCYGRMVGVYC